MTAPVRPAPAQEVAPSHRPAHLRVVEAPAGRRAERRRRASTWAAAGAAVLVAVAFALVYLHVVLAEQQFELDKVQSQVQSEEQSYQDLRLKVAQLGSPANVISTAEGKLGMQQPSSVTYLTLPGSAARAKGFGTGGQSAQAPAGDANWPQIKAELAGSP